MVRSPAPVPRLSTSRTPAIPEPTASASRFPMGRLLPISLSCRSRNARRLSSRLSGQCQDDPRQRACLAQQDITLTSPTGTALANVTAINNPSPTDTPSGVQFPVGFVDFNIHGLAVGGSTTLTLTLPAGVTANDYYQYGPTADNPTSHWYEFLYDGQTGATFIPQSDGSTEIMLYYVDGQRGDSDLLANGQIVDPGAPALRCQASAADCERQRLRWDVQRSGLSAPRPR